MLCACLYEQGFLPQAMKNYLSLLGWNDGTEKEIFTEEELEQAFDLRRVVKSAAVFDMQKLRWMNGQVLCITYLHIYILMFTHTHAQQLCLTCCACLTYDIYVY
jgi:glutamyl/glutaminyl-tRNA synthetase